MNGGAEGNDANDNPFSPDFASAAIDFFSIANYGTNELSDQAFPLASLSSVTNSVSGRGLESSLACQLTPTIDDTLNDHAFANKNIYGDVYSVTNDVREMLIGTYDLKAMAATNGFIPLTLTNGHNNDILVRFVHVNAPPVPGDFSTNVNYAIWNKIPKSSLTSIASDIDLDTIVLSGVSGTSTNGMTVFTNENYIAYFAPSTNVVDAFDYTLSDGNGGTSIGRAVLNVVVPEVLAPNFTRFDDLPDGNKRVNYLGAPEHKYRVQASPNLDEPIQWEDISPDIIASTNGAFYFDDLESTNYTSRFYRTRYVPETQALSPPPAEGTYNFAPSTSYTPSTQSLRSEKVNIFRRKNEKLKDKRN